MCPRIFQYFCRLAWLLLRLPSAGEPPTSQQEGLTDKTLQWIPHQRCLCPPCQLKNVSVRKVKTSLKSSNKEDLVLNDWIQNSTLHNFVRHAATKDPGKFQIQSRRPCQFVCRFIIEDESKVKFCELR